MLRTVVRCLDTPGCCHRHLFVDVIIVNMWTAILVGCRFVLVCDVSRTHPALPKNSRHFEENEVRNLGTSKLKFSSGADVRTVSCAARLP